MGDGDARQRILDAALREFGQHGYMGASIRRIARTAGVSPALVQYHFGTKEILREECDATALEWFQQYREDGIEHGYYSDPGYLSEAMTSAAPILEYLVTAFASNSEVASTWYEQVQRMMREILGEGSIGPPVTEDDDVDAVSAVLAAMALGVTLFYREIARVLGTGEHPEVTMLRVARARVLLAPERIVSAEFLEQSRAGIATYADAMSQREPDGESNGAGAADGPARRP